MATAAQIAANQANAQLSTGPKTAEGKARVSQNALRHGLTSTRLVIRDDEHEEFNSLRDELKAELDPQGAIEEFTFQELMHAAWNLHRFRRIEAEASLGTLDDFTDPQTTSVLDRLSRYQARAQRAYYKALNELRTLQTNRAMRAFKLHPDDEPEAPAISDIDKLTKQSRSSVMSEAIKQAISMVQYETGILNLKILQDAEARQTGRPTASMPSAVSCRTR
jgi:hypothetical protein